MKLIKAYAVVLFFFPLCVLAQTQDYQTDVIDINNLSVWTATNGMTSHNPITDASGAEFPKGSGKHVIFSEGFVWGGMQDGELKVGGATYRYGLQPGKILPGGYADDPTDKRYHIYKVRVLTPTTYQQLSTQMQARLENDFQSWPVEDGAPWVDVDGNGMYEPNFTNWVRGIKTTDYPLFKGDEALWWVANDLDETKTNRLYGTPPVGLEVQTTFWAYTTPGLLSNTVFMKYKLVNKSEHAYEDVYFTKWVDADVGDAFDDFVGIDTVCNMAYAYNAGAYDSVYFNQPPAVGHVLVQGPIVPAPGKTAIFAEGERTGFDNQPVSSFSFYGGGDNLYADPSLGSSFGAQMFYRNMQGLLWNGNNYVDPTTGLTVLVPMAGDPIIRHGWIDGIIKAPGDRRHMFSTGPCTILAGDTQEVVYALTVAQGNDNMHSLELLLQNACELQALYPTQYVVSTGPVTALPESVEISAVYPNPNQRDIITVGFRLGTMSEASLVLTNVLGQRVQTLQLGVVPPGNYTRSISTNGLAPGTYIVTLHTPGLLKSQSIVIH